MRRAVAIVAALMVGCGPAASSTGSTSSSSSSSAGSGGQGVGGSGGASGGGDGVGGAGGEMVDAGPAVCTTTHDCPDSFQNQPICTVVSCDPSGDKTYPGSHVRGCYVQDVALFTPCFLNGCPGFCSGDGPAGGGEPPWMCSYPPGSACGDGG